ncbi:DUF2501 domain-containing protein [Acidocella sp.]|uniref:DUF2501 domain-containing protein n=1 Tax=Acidocella sp. TaxID=50710 RepID=UPI0026090AE1|nr:DUF2501 domain-containing protein [Acidocella sp.]MDD2794682.1 DUF2501 domain-containing protein [Acidocella sp.]
MRKGKFGFAAAAVVAVGVLAAPAARAQLSGMLQGAMGGGQSSPATSGLGNMSMGSAMGSGLNLPTLGAAPPTNLAGILQYCIQNNYLGGGVSASSASSIQQSLLRKYTGSSSAPEANSGFASGSSGILDTGNGNTMSLGGSGLKAQLTQKICDQVLQHAQSML